MPPVVRAADVQRILDDVLGESTRYHEPLKGGAWSSAWGFETAAGRFVARFSDRRGDFERDQFAMRWSSPDLPIPRVSLLAPCVGGYLCISERVGGAPFDDLDANAMRRTLPSLFRALDHMRRIDLGDAPGYGGITGDGQGKHISQRDWLAAVYENDSDGNAHWRRNLVKYPDAGAMFHRAALAMEQLIPAIGDRRNVTHVDLLNYNVHVDQHRLCGVFDWGCATYTDFLYDVAWFEFWAPWYPQWRDLPIATWLINEFRSVDADLDDLSARMTGLLLHIGLNHIRYHAFRDDPEQIAAVVERTRTVLAGNHPWGIR